jgi:hypothetical protein
MPQDGHSHIKPKAGPFGRKGLKGVAEASGSGSSSTLLKRQKHNRCRYIGPFSEVHGTLSLSIDDSQ